MNRIVDILLYGGIGKEKLNKVKGNIVEENRRYIVIYTSIIVIGMSALCLFSLFKPILRDSVPSYLVCIGVSLLLLVLTLAFGKKNPYVVFHCQYSMFLLLLAFGIYLGTIVEPNQASASFAVLIFAAPLLFIDRPIRIDITIIIAIAIYLIIAYKTQTPEMFAFNKSVILPYGLTNLVLSALIMKVKVERVALAYDNKLLSEIDQLTGMLNRRSFENQIDELRKRDNIMGLKMCSFDVNGLKRLNDSKGHIAGDELLCAAAKCLEGVFGRYGKCYRIGGDEFMAIIDGECPEPEELAKELNELTKNYKGEFVDGFTISIGIVMADKDSKIDKLITEADNKMYVNKTEYYRLNNLDRRVH